MRDVESTFGWRPWAFSALFWAALGTVFVVHEHLVWPRGALLDALGRDLPVYWLPYVLTTPPIFAVCARLQERQPSWGRHVGVLLAVLGAGVCFHLTLSASIQHLLPAASAGADPAPRPSWWAAVLQRLRQSWPFQTINYAGVIAVAHAVAYRRGLRRRQRETAELRRELSSAQLAALRNQLQPHFLFNTLHAIGVTCRRDPEEANRMIVWLGDLLRRTLEHPERQTVPLSEELELLSLYLAIQKARFKDRLDVVLDVAPDARDCAVPTLLLQPLCENAIRHGIEAHAGRGTVRIRAARDDPGWLCLRVTNEGEGAATELPEPLREGVGLGNTRARLRALYGARHDLQIAPAAPSGVEVTVRLPAERPAVGDQQEARDDR